MSTEITPPHSHVTVSRAVRHHLTVVVIGLLLGAVAGWLYAASLPVVYTSTTRVLVNPSVGNPFVPSPTAVRQDEPTSLETEAQVVRSEEVLGLVADRHPPLTVQSLQRGLRITVPPNTQILEISFSAADPAVAQDAADRIADAYLDNRARRFEEVNDTRIDQLQTQADDVTADLRAATAAAQKGSEASRTFQGELATALRNQLVNVQAQRAALDNSDSPAGAVIAPGTEASADTNLVAMVAPVGGAAAGLALGCLIALLLERTAGAVRSPADVEEIGLPVAAAVPRRSWRNRLLRRRDPEARDTTIRRLRAQILELDPRPDVIAVAPAGGAGSQAEVSEAIAESFARAGHRVVLVRADEHAAARGLVVEDGLAQALLYERLDVLELLQPSVEPLLCLLPSGEFTAQSRELLIAARVREVLAPLVGAGNLVVIQSPGVDTPEGEAMISAADLSLVVVTTGLTRLSEVEQAARRGDATTAALVVGTSDIWRKGRLAADSTASHSRQEETAKSNPLSQTRR